VVLENLFFVKKGLFQKEDEAPQNLKPGSKTKEIVPTRG
jgi:hypothetical protein